MHENLGSWTSPEVQKCPLPFLNRLLADAPVYRDPGSGMWIVSRYDDISYVHAHPELFSNQTAVMINRTDSPVAKEVACRFATRGFPELNTLPTVDPPLHTAHRTLVDKVFTPSYVKSLEPYIVMLANELIDDFIETGTADLLRQFAIQLPMYIIADQLGVERADYPRFKLWSDVTVERNNPLVAPERELEIVDHLIEMQNYLFERVQRYRVEPGDNLISRLVHANSEGKPLDDAEIVGILHILLVAGNETTTNGITNAFYLMLADPAIQASLQANRELLGAYVEEVLRAHAPIPHLYRIAVEDTRIGDHDVPKGAVLQMSYLAANHDPTKWVEPERMEIGRKGGRHHLAFGRGIHFCLGHLLARAEMRLSLATIMDRLQNMRFSPNRPAPEFAPHFQVHGLDHLTICFDPR